MRFKLIGLMTTIILTGCTTLDTMILGMPLERSITPNSVKKYQTPQELIDGESLNGSDKTGKLYNPNLGQISIPHKYFQSLCISKNGKFSTVHTERNPKIGTFMCSERNTAWAIHIRETQRVKDASRLHISVVNNSFVQSQRNRTIGEEKQKYELIKAEEKRQKDITRQYEQAVLNNAPKANDIGSTICKDTSVLEATGIVVMGQQHYNEVPKARIVASLENFGTGNQNIKINLKGWVNRNDQISSGAAVVYKQTPLESGRVIWDNKQGWFKCNY